MAVELAMQTTLQQHGASVIAIQAVMHSRAEVDTVVQCLEIVKTALPEDTASDPASSGKE